MHMWFKDHVHRTHELLICTVHSLEEWYDLGR